jgi:MoaA/NifB/PqqE/SkfB family radical SAM enzyme
MTLWPRVFSSSAGLGRFIGPVLKSAILSRSPNQERPLRTLVGTVEAAIRHEPADFFRVVDTARDRYREAICGDLPKAILGLKISNLLIAKHEYLRGSIVTTAHPISFMLDTANQCQLGCPSCTNTFNRAYADATFNPWPRGVLKDDCFDKFINSVGLSAFSGHFYNNHEPFLNKKTPAYLRVASDMQIETFVSSNLSFPKLDHDAIVRSGLKELMVALDGLTQETYERYRKGGRIEWAFANVRAIADAKKRLGSTTPYIRWQWLTFAHNIHEVPAAIEFAREIGFDSFNLATPNRVDQDDPSVEAIRYPGPDEHRAVVINQRAFGNFESDLEPYREAIEARFREKAIDRWDAAGGPRTEQPMDRFGDRCDWLHMAVISDAKGRIVPCCKGDYRDSGEFIFATIDEHHGNLLNTPLYRESRLLLANPVAHRYATIGRPPESQTRCQKCAVRPQPQIGLGAVHSWFFWSANEQLKELGNEELAGLHNWSRHQTVRPNQTAKLAFAGPVEGARFHNLHLPEVSPLGPAIVEHHVEKTDVHVDLFVHAAALPGAEVTLSLTCGSKEIGTARASATGWLHFQMRGMSTPGDYLVDIVLATAGQETARYRAAAFNVTLGGVITLTSRASERV